MSKTEYMEYKFSGMERKFSGSQGATVDKVRQSDPPKSVRKRAF